MKKTLLLILPFCLLGSCRQQSSSLFKAAPQSSHSEQSLRSILLDSIPLDSINTSSFGESCISPDGEIVFVDKYFCTVSLYDTLGHSKGTWLGYGGGPRETQIGRIAANTMLPDGRLLLMGHNLDVYLYRKVLNEDKSMGGYEVEKVFVLQREPDEDWAATSFSYTNQYNDMVCRSCGDCFYTNVYSDHPDHLKLDDMTDYINRCRHIWEIDFQEGKEGRLLAAGYPQSYAEQDGLQIYRNGTLLGDVAVPEGFRVMGYIAPYYYSHIIPSMEAEDTSMWIYRFKL